MRKRRSKRWKWLAWIASVIVCVALVGFWSWNYAINTFMNSMIAEMEKQLELELEQIWAEAGGQASWIASGGSHIGDGLLLDPSSPVSSEGSTHDSVTGGTSPTYPGSSSGGVSSAHSGSDTVSSDGVSGSIGGASSGFSGDSVSGSVGGTSGTQGAPSLAYEPDISLVKAKQTQESMTMKEKTRVTTILLKRLSLDDIRTLIGTASGGITVEDKRASKELFLDKLTEAEYNELIDIAAKYGLSSGKDYQSSLAGTQSE